MESMEKKAGAMSSREEGIVNYDGTKVERKGRTRTKGLDDRAGCFAILDVPASPCGVVPYMSTGILDKCSVHLFTPLQNNKPTDFSDCETREIDLPHQPFFTSKSKFTCHHEPGTAFDFERLLLDKHARGVQGSCGPRPTSSLRPDRWRQPCLMTDMAGPHQLFQPPIRALHPSPRLQGPARLSGSPMNRGLSLQESNWTNVVIEASSEQLGFLLGIRGIVRLSKANQVHQPVTSTSAAPPNIFCVAMSILPPPDCLVNYACPPPSPSLWGTDHVEV
ncbi:hypothetical protein V8F06_007188 [Rhypophila decipiens]